MSMALQVVEVSIFGPEKAKKNIKGRVSLSDGVSKMICMIPDKVYFQMVSASPPRPAYTKHVRRRAKTRRFGVLTSG